MTDQYATEEAAEENGGELYPANIRAMQVFEPTPETADHIDLAGFHLRTEDNSDIWVVADENSPDATVLFALDPDQFATSRQLHAYLAAINNGENDTEPDNEPDDILRAPEVH